MKIAVPGSTFVPKMKKSSIFLCILFFCGAMLHAQSAAVHLKTATEAYVEQNYEKAAAEYKTALQKDPKSADAYMGLGNSLQKSGRIEEAKAAFKKAETLAPNKLKKSYIENNHGNALMTENKYQEAAEQYKKALKNNPESEMLRRNYQIALKKMQQENQQSENSSEKEQQQKDQQTNNSENPQSGSPQSPSGKQENQNKMAAGGQDGSDKKGSGKNNRSDASGKEHFTQSQREQMMNGIRNRESRTAGRILNKNAYYEPESREKDW